MRQRRGETTRVRIAVVGVLATTLVPAGASAGPASCGGRITTTKDGWTRVAAPDFPGAVDVLQAFAVTPTGPRALLATNGSSIMRSTDGGCRWTAAYTVPQLPAPFGGSVATVDDIVATRDRFYAVVTDLAVPRVLVSADRGATWAPKDLPAVETRLTGKALKLTADATGRHAYLLVRSTRPLDAADVVHATADGGATWTANPVPVGFTSAPHLSVRDIGADPMEGSDVWISTTAGLLQSSDAARTWRLRDDSERGGDLGMLAVTHRPGAPLQIVVASEAEPLVHLRGNGGGLTAVNTPTPVTSIAGGRTITEAAITTDLGLFELDYFDLTWSPAHRGAPVLTRLTTDYTAAPRFYACDCGEDGSIWSRSPRTFSPDAEPPPHPPFPGDEGCAPSKRQAEPAPSAPTAVLPRDADLTIEPGRSRTVRYRFRVQPRLVDVYFLLANGHESWQFACAAAQGGAWAAQHLARVRNLRAGLGVYREYPNTLGLPIPGLSGCIGTGNDKSLVYRRTLPLTPVGAPLQQAMSRINPSSCEPSGAALTALVESVTGAGRDVPPSGDSAADISPGQDAGFAPEALKVIVHVAGTEFDEPDRPRPGPDMDETVAELVANDVKQVGILVPPPRKKHHEGDAVDQPEAQKALEDLIAVARGSRAFAQREAVCSGKLEEVVRPGKPLVCVYTDDAGADETAPAMGSQMAELVKAFTDFRPMSFGVLDGDSVVADLGPSAPRTLDHLLPHTLTYSVTYRCKPSDAGEVKRVVLGGKVAGDVVARAETTVRCGAPPVVAPPEVPEFIPLGAPIVQLVAPAAPQLPPNNLAPNTAPQPNAQAQNGMQGVAAGAAVPQEEQQPRLAYANAADPQPQGVDELAMSALPRPDPYRVPPWLVLEVALLTTAAGATAAHRRRTALARTRLRHQRF